MADSNITKKALAAALRELMEEVPFEKINVAHICEKCNMNRKSFYYHFKDKYDLVNWIFDTDFIALNKDLSKDRWEALEVMCNYFYENRKFYRRALQIKGQNSFSEHFREFIHPLLRHRIELILGENDIPQICIDFFADGITCAMERWLSEKNCMPADQFISIMKMLVKNTAEEIHQTMDF